MILETYVREVLSSVVLIQPHHASIFYILKMIQNIRSLRHQTFGYLKILVFIVAL